MLPLAKAFFGCMDFGSVVRFVKIVSKGGSGLDKKLDKEKTPYIFVGMVCVREQFQGQGYMRKVMDIAFSEGNRLKPTRSQNATSTFTSAWSLQESADSGTTACCTTW